MKTNLTRRIFLLLLTVVLVLSFTATAFAEDAGMDVPVVEEIPAQPVIDEQTGTEPAADEELEPTATLLPRPMNLIAKMWSGGGNVVELGWKSGGHDYIVVLRATDMGGPWTDLGGLSQSDYGEGCLYLDRDVTPGTTYYYELLYYYGEGERQHTDPVTITIPSSPIDPPLPVPQRLYAKMWPDEPGVVEIGWGNTGYEADVYRATSANGPYTLYTSKLEWADGDEFDDPKLLDRNVTPGTTYYYKACLIYYPDGEGGIKISGDQVGPVSVKVPETGVSGDIPMPKDLTVELSPAVPEWVWVEWHTDNNVDGYKIYRSTSEGGSYTLIDTVANDSSFIIYSDRSTVQGKTYYYKVCAYATISGVTKTSDMAGPVSIKVPGASSGTVGRVTGVTAKSAGYNSIKLTWDRLSGADGYYIYRKTSANGSYSSHKKLSSGTLSYTDRSLTTGKVYYYRVVAYKNSGSSVLRGASSATAKAKPLVAAVTGLSADSWGKRVVLTWSRSSGASGYYVQRATSRYGTYKTVKRLSNVGSYTDYNLAWGVVYYYRLIPYRTVSGTRISGTASGVVYGGYYGY